MSMVRLAASLLIVSSLAACGAPQGKQPATSTSSSAAPVAQAPIVVQGAMPVETQVLADALQNRTEQQVQGWTFWSGTIDGYPVVVSKTKKGMTNAAASTALAIERFHPLAIINQGTAGGHDPALHVLDIVVGTATANIGVFRTAERAKGAGTDFAGWRPMDLLLTEGSAGQDPRVWTMRRFEGDASLIAAAHAAAPRYTQGTVVDGLIGSSDVWNSELDRIERLHTEFGTTAEEMEAAAAAQVAGMSKVPFLGIRVLSNNITNQGAYNGASADACQQYVLEVVREYIRQRASH